MTPVLEEENLISNDRPPDTITAGERTRLFNVLEALPGYACLLAADHSISYANQKFIQLFGQPENKTCYQVFRDRRSPCKTCPTFNTFKSGQETWESVSPHGRSYMIYDILLHEDNGTPLVLEIGLDISHRKLSEDEMRSKEEMFRTIADFTYDWEYLLCIDGSLGYSSPSCMRITGREAQDYIDDPDLLVKIAHADDRESLQKHLKESSTNEKVYALDYRILNKEGEERWIGHACQPVYNKQGVHIGRRASNRDITENKNAQKALLQAERLAAMGRLVASLAHEINNPLQAISNSLELAIEFPLDEEERRKYLVGAREEVAGLIQITRDILAYTRPHELVYSISSVSKVIQHTLEMCEEKLNRFSIKPTVNIPQNLPDIPISAEHLGQVFLNLVINAIDQMRDGGLLSISAEQYDEMVIVSFQDSGSGIPENKMDYIFEPFFTTKTEGTGLGLSISQNIIKTYQGKITAENLQDGGALFKVHLPLAVHSN